MVEGCEGWVVLVKEVGLGVGSGVGGAPVVDIGFAGLGAGSKLSTGCRPYLSFAPRLGLRGLSFQYLRSTKSRSLTVEKVLNPLPSSLSTVSNLFWDLNVIHLGHTAVGSDGLPLGGDKDGSISPRQGGQVRDGDGHILRLVPWR